MIDLSNKTAVVFAAGGAIGGAVAKEFAAAGAKIYLSGRDLTAIENLAAEITASGGRAQAARVDALNETEIDDYLRKIVAENGRLDAVFNAVGIRVEAGGYGTPATALSFEQFLEPLRVHVGSQFLTARSAARLMIETESAGTILTLAASLSRLKVPFMAGITAASTAIEGLTRSLAGEFGNFGIRVICLNPTGLSETRTIRETNAANAKTIGIPPVALEQTLSQQWLLGKAPTLADVGKLAAFLVSDAGAILNSHVVDADFGNRSVI